MAIKEKTLQEEGAKYTLLMDGTQTLTEAIKLFEEKKSPENDTYLVLALPNAQYHVILFSELKKRLREGAIRLSDLPIPPASRVVPMDTTESGGEILDWVASNPQSTVVVTDAGKFTGLFVNPTMGGDSGLVEDRSFSTLYGSLQELGGDPRLIPIPKVAPLTCPDCRQNSCEWDTEQELWLCRNCNKSL